MLLVIHTSIIYVANKIMILMVQFMAKFTILLMCSYGTAHVQVYRNTLALLCASTHFIDNSCDVLEFMKNAQVLERMHTYSRAYQVMLTSDYY